MQSPYFADVPAHYLREWRKKRGLTLEKLAERCDSSVPNISRYEKPGERLGLPLWLMFRLVDALEILPGQFFAPPEVPCLDAFAVNLSAKERRDLLETVKIVTALPSQERSELLEALSDVAAGALKAHLSPQSPQSTPNEVVETGP